eukprot:COSAG01_NODE_7066_length_3369_cov_5.472171_6_plen_25_part_01
MDTLPPELLGHVMSRVRGSLLHDSG